MARKSERYARHLILPEVGANGQLKLERARVLCVGAGGLGSPALLYLAAAGVGHIGIVDGDTVDVTNLQRQVLFDEASVGKSKAQCARERLRALNPLIDLKAFPVRLDETNVFGILEGYDCIVDGTDNFKAKYLINDACVAMGKVNVFAGILQFEAQCTVFHPEGPCYRCLFPVPPVGGVNCAEAGVLGVLPGIVGAIQAAEVLKHVLGLGDSLRGRLLLFDALSMKFTEMKIARNPECRACAKKEAFSSFARDEDACASTRARLS